MVTRTNPFENNKQNSISNPFCTQNDTNINSENSYSNNNNTSNISNNLNTFKKPPKKEEIVNRKNKDNLNNNLENYSNTNSYTNQFNNSNTNNFNAYDNNYFSGNNNMTSSVEKANYETLVNKEYEALKEYNCSPYSIRSSVNVLPSNLEVLKESGVNIGITLTPMSKFASLPVITYENDQEIPRCCSPSCRAYINPFNQWIEGGDKWICNMCKYKNTTQNYYFESTDKSGERKDKGTRPEISTGSYEFIANSSYIDKKKKTKKPVYLIVLDVSLAAVHNGFLSSAVESIKSAIDEIYEYEEEIKIGIITYDVSIHFYCLHNKLSEPQMYSISSKDIFLPIPAEYLLVDLFKCKDNILSCLDNIQNNFNNNTNREATTYIETLDAIHLISKDTGAKVLLFNASNCIIDNPKLKATLKVPQDEIIYTATDNRFFGNKGMEFTNNHISIDLFISAAKYTNLLTLNQLCDYTNGNIYFFKKFRTETHYKSLYSKIFKILTVKRGLDAVMRTRISGAYATSHYITPVLITNGDLLVLSNIDEDQSYTFSLDFKTKTENLTNVNNNYSNNIINNNQDNYLYIQSALLYTHFDGSRRIRVHNLCLPLSNKISIIHESIDSEAMISQYTKVFIDSLFKSKKMLNSILSVEDKLKTLIASSFSSSHSLSKEVPEQINYLLLYFLGLTKNRIACKDEIAMKLDIDTSNYIRIKMQKMAADEIINFVYPKFYQIHHMISNKEIGTLDENEVIILPDIINNHSNSLESDGVYLVDNGFALFLYVKLEICSELCFSFFKVSNLNQIKEAITEEILFSNSDSDNYSKALFSIVEYIRSIKTFCQPLLIVFESTESERLITECLVSDNLCPWMKFDFNAYKNNILGESYSNTARGRLKSNKQ